MSGKRTNFKTMSQKDFVAYLEERDIPYIKLETTTLLGLSITKIKPEHFRLGERLFDSKNGEQLDPNIELTEIAIKPKTTKSLSKKQLIKIIDECIQNMGTKGVYHPKRLKPKWNSLTDDDKKLALFEKYISSKESSIGFLKLIEVNLCHKTLEAIIIEFPTAIEYFKIDDAKSRCIEKFIRYDNGKCYLIENGIDPAS